MASYRLIFVVLVAAFGLACGEDTKKTTTTTSSSNNAGSTLYNPWYYPSYNYGWGNPWGNPWGLGYYGYGMLPNFGAHTVTHHAPTFPFYGFPQVSTSQVTHHAPFVPHVTSNTVTHHAPYPLANLGLYGGLYGYH